MFNSINIGVSFLENDLSRFYSAFADMHISLQYSQNSNFLLFHKKLYSGVIHRKTFLDIESLAANGKQKIG